MPRSSRSARSPRVLMTKQNAGKCPRKKPGGVTDPSARGCKTRRVTEAYRRKQAHSRRVQWIRINRQTHLREQECTPHASGLLRFMQAKYGRVHSPWPRKRHIDKFLCTFLAGIFWVGKSYPVERRGVYQYCRRQWEGWYRTWLPITPRCGTYF